MNAITKLKEKLKNRDNIYSSILCFINSTSLPSIYKSADLDFLVMDLEHGDFCPENIGDFLEASIREDLPVIARVQDCEYHCISKTLDMGCDGVLIPRTETMEQVETAIRSMRVYPLGKKGIGGRALLRANEKIEDFNENRLLFLQIESEQGVSLLNDILLKYGDQIAGILIGPCDMAVSLGCGLDIDAEPVLEQITKTIEICQKHQKSVGMFMGNDTVISRWKDAGMNIFWTASEAFMMYKGLCYVRDIIKNL